MLRKHRKNTFFMALLVGISAISLATLGYSVWMAGIQDNKSSVDTTVSMDFAVNNTIIATVTPTKVLGSENTINIDSGSTVADENNPLGRPSSETKSNRDLNNSMQIEIIASKNATINKVDIAMAIKTSSTSRPDLNIVPNFADSGSDGSDKTLIGYTPVKIKDSDTSDIFGRPLAGNKFSSDYTFLDLSVTTISGSSFIQGTYSLNGYNRFIYDGSDFSFKFGTFFGGKADPESFYNPYIKGYRETYRNYPTEENKNTYLKSIQAATDELNLMYRIINGSKISVTFTADCTFSNVES